RKDELRSSVASTGARSRGLEAMATRRRGRVRLAPRGEPHAGLLSAARLTKNVASASRAMEDARDARRMLAFALERHPERVERRGERENVAGDQEVVVVGADRVPVNAARGDGHLRYEIRAREGDAVLGKATQRDSPDHAILGSHCVPVQKFREPLDLLVRRQGGGEPNPEARPARRLDTGPGALPCAVSTVPVVQLG